MNIGHSPGQPFSSGMWFLVLIQRNIRNCSNFRTCCRAYLFYFLFYCVSKHVWTSELWCQLELATYSFRWKSSSWDSVKSEALLKFSWKACFFICHFKCQSSRSRWAGLFHKLQEGNFIQMCQEVSQVCLPYTVTLIFISHSMQGKSRICSGRNGSSMLI